MDMNAAHRVYSRALADMPFAAAQPSIHAGLTLCLQQHSNK